MEVKSKPMPQISESDKNRFLSKIGYTANKDTCWEWKGGRSKNGYGNFGIKINKRAKNIITSRLSYFIHYNKDPFGFVVLHKCDNKGCVNPNHLSLGSNKQNSEDMVKKGRQARGERSAKSKLNKEQVIEARNEYANNKVTYVFLAKKYGIMPCSMKSIIKRETWAHV